MGNDRLSAQGGNSTLDGGAGNDVLEGRGNGDDRLRWRTRAAIINSGKAANDETANAWRVAA